VLRDEVPQVCPCFSFLRNGQNAIEQRHGYR
jgi:hypothetical protein